MAKLAPTQIEQLQSIGAYLRQVRQEQGLSIDVLANQIFIRPALLQALELGHDAELPEPVFIQGFIRRYGEALGLDGQTIAKEFRVTPVEVLPTPELVERVDTNGHVGNGRVENGRVEPQVLHGARVAEPALATSTVRSERRSPLPLLLGLAALTALGLGVWALLGRSSVTSQANNSDPAAETAPAASDPDPAPDEAESPEPQDTADSSPSAPPEAPVVVSATLSDRAWLSVIADGERVYEGTAEAGYEETWTAQTSVVFRTGNAGGVELSVNGDRAVTVGNNGVVRTLTFTPSSGVETLQSP